MHLTYKILLVLFVVLAGINIYAIDWQQGLMHPDNTKFIFSFAAAVLAIILIFVMNTWSKLRSAK